MKRKQGFENRLVALEHRSRAALGPLVVNVMRVDGDRLNPRPIQGYGGLSFPNGGPGISPDDPPEASWWVERESGESDEALYERAIEAAIKCEGRGIPILMFASERLPGELPTKRPEVHVGLPDGGYSVE